MISCFASVRCQIFKCAFNCFRLPATYGFAKVAFYLLQNFEIDSLRRADVGRTVHGQSVARFPPGLQRREILYQRKFERSPIECSYSISCTCFACCYSHLHHSFRKSFLGRGFVEFQQFKFLQSTKVC